MVIGWVLIIFVGKRSLVWLSPNPPLNELLKHVSRRIVRFQCATANYQLILAAWRYSMQTYKLPRSEKVFSYPSVFVSQVIAALYLSSALYCLSTCVSITGSFSPTPCLPSSLSLSLSLTHTHTHTHLLSMKFAIFESYSRPVSHSIPALLLT